MKITYLTEGVFKTPEQIKREREKRASQSNAEKLAKLSSDMLTKFIEGRITDYFTFLPKNSSYYNIPENRSKYNGLRWSIVNLIKPFEPFADISGWNNNNALTIIPKIKYEDDKILCDVYIEREHTPWSMMQSSEYHIPMMTLSSFKIMDYVRDFTKEIEKCIQYDMGLANETEKKIYEMMLSKDILLNKIHMLGGMTGNCVFLIDSTKKGNRTLYDAVVTANALSTLFSLENKGKCYLKYFVPASATKKEYSFDLDDEGKDIFAELLEFTMTPAVKNEKNHYWSCYDQRQLELQNNSYIPRMFECNAIERAKDDFNLKVVLFADETKLELEIEEGKVTQLEKTPIIHAMYIIANKNIGTNKPSLRGRLNSYALIHINRPSTKLYGGTANPWQVGFNMNKILEIFEEGQRDVGVEIDKDELAPYHSPCTYAATATYTPDSPTGERLTKFMNDSAAKFPTKINNRGVSSLNYKIDIYHFIEYEKEHKNGER